MKSITTYKDLKQEIALLEAKQAENAAALKEQFRITYDSLRPANLIISTMKELTASPDFKSNLLNTTLGIGAGFLTKKVIIGTTLNPIKQLIGFVLQTATTGIVAKNGDGIKLMAKQMLGRFLTRRNRKSEVE